MKQTNKIILTVFLLLIFAMPSLAVDPPIHINAISSQKDVVISWRKVLDARGYNIYRKEAGEAEYTKINFALVSDDKYADRNVVKGKDYVYYVKSVDEYGAESASSMIIGAPRMQMNVKALVTHAGETPVSQKSIRTGKLVTFAVPGDIITYKIALSNQGASSASNVNIEYAIPDGTIITGIPKVEEGPKVIVSYYDIEQKMWVKEVTEEQNVSKVRFTVVGDIPPAKSADEDSGILSFKVLIGL
jgi:uncharacterized repeat protein (TIGR01451 family)